MLKGQKPTHDILMKGLTYFITAQESVHRKSAISSKRSSVFSQNIILYSA